MYLNKLTSWALAEHERREGAVRCIVTSTVGIVFIQRAVQVSLMITTAFGKGSVLDECWFTLNTQIDCEEKTLEIHDLFEGITVLYHF